MSGYTTDSINKIGNTVIFLATNMQPLSKTKLLKLLYLLEEFSVKKYNIPFLDLRFEVWQAGPVAKDIFIDLSQDEPIMLNKFVSLEYLNFNGVIATFIKPKKEFNDDEFSDINLVLLKIIVEKFKDSSAKDLVKLTHRPNSPWFQIAKETGLLEQFENGKLTSSNIEIDFRSLLEGNQIGKVIFEEQKEFNEFVKQFKN